MNIQISGILSRDSLQFLWDHRFGIWNVRRDHVQILNSNFFEIEVPSIDILMPDLFFSLRQLLSASLQQEFPLSPEAGKY